MKLRSLILMAVVAITPPAYADEAMTVAQEIVSNWQTAYNSGTGKIADLYVQDAVFSSGVLGVLKGKSEIEKALADQMKKTPKITLNLLDAHQKGNVVWYYLDFVFPNPNGPSGHAGVTAVNDAGLWHIAMYVSNATPPKQQ
jgi:ketosteroid isomerase-like protein